MKITRTINKIYQIKSASILAHFLTFDFLLQSPCHWSCMDFVTCLTQHWYVGGCSGTNNLFSSDLYLDYRL